ncbi:trypsin-like peptidase domain-containing protein [Pseudomonas fluorescens]|uniref:trypsin-like peptidase domain-containing protein n=1 Tax=Pseudomonas fluorescens TaxID=294 RepID=UPI001782D746|nr:trypsin-like peptidase domain-containing protein [Pseudomonas fluorescens]MBD8235020.1 trypsin-like peptidase domain-containing protein [Pseudomonas fluorescens]MDY0896367.1 trypsin-like peptidase domain-containing protein [Pseudomonas fluorescens]
MSKLKLCKSVDELAALLGTTYGKIRYFYYLHPTSESYSTFEIKKKSGGVREISAPSDKLKTLQGRLKVLLSEIYEPKKYVTGFVNGKSIVVNAKPHARKKFVFNLDLQDFFPSITFARVRGLLISKPYSLDSSVATVISHLVTVNGKLPQGGPCSPVISNMICSSLDRKLKTLAVKNRAEYTRYADDITFSFYDDLEYVASDIVQVLKGDELPNHYFAKCGRSLERLVIDAGFKVNYLKVRLQGRYERQVVTGLVVNKKPNVNRQYVRKTGAMIHSIEIKGLEEARRIHSEKIIKQEKKSGRGKDEEIKVPPVEAHIQGRLLFLKQVVGLESQVYRRLALRFNLLGLKYRVPLGISKNKFSEDFRKFTKWYDSKCWVVEVEGEIRGEFECGQGSGFMISDQVLVTCSHVLDLKGVKLDEATVYQASSRSKNYKANLLYRDDHRDIALLKISADKSEFDYFDLEALVLADVGDEVSILGFPKDKLGAQSAGNQTAFVRNKFPMSGVSFVEVDKELYAGNSGGPVLNQDSRVVGIVGIGNDGEYCDHSRFICVSELLKVLDALKAASVGGSKLEPA